MKGPFFLASLNRVRRCIYTPVPPPRPLNPIITYLPISSHHTHSTPNYTSLFFRMSQYFCPNEHPTGHTSLPNTTTTSTTQPTTSTTEPTTTTTSPDQPSTRTITTPYSTLDQTTTLPTTSAPAETSAPETVSGLDQAHVKRPKLTSEEDEEGADWREENRKMADRRGGDWGKRSRDGFGGRWEGCLMI
ncbi:uncharacterized protein PODANS_7_9660 [Podospora anserina S mat+]|uniref:Podospora anserina S mat+ genomic DNA chromosome 7, supercontig 1 n=1 Tax=Podospora anserina (strain S / ATCC MYA-4624 / DSM 980 / FGSC 10383) TaxID=515849 RepID=B2AX85_PODAN|nr:uncharacterized protein PODANS_7_9660 [Podospora anserina S mat+]CAP69009.1 unnamed protein product [Podospora anserina S mat+]